ncbi:NINE protein [Glaciimonas immobilis]|uniref:TM2 domain-containing membrane protein YozV n=1 Tax=Glaciimonas immobilis TaxID=728004 RepID=A0A840RR72_9BURK|nr:NINE protein [Glaciimonas immobilis]KAF3997871.1 NINE protein [Glaciimonas immobilis]MBB5199488.1 TM2 domain-containing membrane protein YozV [Glaciimonas immobilis]
MTTTHRNKTIATLITAIFGSIGLHRFYLHGAKDVWGWLHFISLPLSLLALAIWPTQQKLFLFAPLLISALIAILEALITGLMPDEKWDLRLNGGSGKKSESTWILAVIIVLTVGVGAIGLIGTIARTFDLLFTGGSYG